MNEEMEKVNDMRIQANKIFTFNNEKYNAVRLYSESRKYKVMKFDKKYNAWVERFKANTLNEVIEILEDGEVH